MYLESSSEKRMQKKCLLLIITLLRSVFSCETDIPIKRKGSVLTYMCPSSNSPHFSFITITQLPENNSSKYYPNDPNDRFFSFNSENGSGSLQLGDLGLVGGRDYQLKVTCESSYPCDISNTSKTEHIQVSVPVPHQRTTVALSHPSTSVLVPHQRTTVAPSHPNTSVPFPHQRTTVASSHPSTSVPVPNKGTQLLFWGLYINSIALIVCLLHVIT